MIEVAEHENDHLLKVGSDFPYSLFGKRFDNIVQIDGLNTINFDDYLSEDDDDYHGGDDSGFKFVYPVSFNGTLDLKRDDFYEKKKFVLWRPAQLLINLRTFFRWRIILYGIFQPIIFKLVMIMLKMTIR
jgi:hypothetical protein